MNTSKTFIQTGTQSFKQPAMQTFNSTSGSTVNETKSQPSPSIKQGTETQTHVHEFEGSTKLAEEGEDRHNHRFAGVTSQVIPVGDSHVHGLFTNTDFLDHHHEIAAITGFPIDVGNGKHVHFVQFFTTMDDGHFHEFQLATLILSPLV